MKTFRKITNKNNPYDLKPGDFLVVEKKKVNFAVSSYTRKGEFLGTGYGSKPKFEKYSVCVIPSDGDFHAGMRRVNNQFISENVNTVFAQFSKTMQNKYINEKRYIDENNVPNLKYVRDRLSSAIRQHNTEVTVAQNKQRYEKDQRAKQYANTIGNMYNLTKMLNS
jgi:hypothetical protein